MRSVDVPTVDTERLRLRPWRDDDLDTYAAMCADVEIMRYLNRGIPLSREEAWRQMATFVGHWQLRGFGTWAVEERTSDRCVGRVGLHQPEGWPGLEVGWTIAREFWGQGYATEAGRASLEYAWNVLGATRVISVIAPPNVASIRVAQRLGETYERDWQTSGIDVHIYGIDRP